MPRDPNPVGSFGKLNRVEVKEGSWMARAYVRDLDGERRLVSRSANTGAAAERALLKALTERIAPSNTGIGPTLLIRDVAERWYAEIQAAVDAGEKSHNTVRLYRHYLDRHILPAVGALRVREATVSRLDDFVSTVGTRSGTAAAKARRSALSGVMGYAARHGAIATNPVRDIGRIRGVGGRVKARSLSVDECERWLAQLESDKAAVRRDLPDLTRWFLGTGSASARRSPSAGTPSTSTDSWWRSTTRSCVSGAEASSGSNGPSPTPGTARSRYHCSRRRCSNAGCAPPAE